MARVAVCLFFLAIFQIGILKSLAEETEAEAVTKNNEETTAKPTEDKLAQDKEAPTKVEPENKIKGTTKIELTVGKASDVLLSKDDKPNEEKAAKKNESKKEDVIEKITGSGTRKFLPDILKAVQGDTGNQTNGFLDIPKTILGPVNAVGATINGVVSKGLDTAKDFAGGTFNFLRNTINGAFGNN